VPHAFGAGAYAELAPDQANAVRGHGPAQGDATLVDPERAEAQAPAREVEQGQRDHAARVRLERRHRALDEDPGARTGFERGEGAIRDRAQVVLRRGLAGDQGRVERAAEACEAQARLREVGGLREHALRQSLEQGDETAAALRQRLRDAGFGGQGGAEGGVPARGRAYDRHDALSFVHGHCLIDRGGAGDHGITSNR
jgi:hypothetical protein